MLKTFLSRGKLLVSLGPEFGSYPHKNLLKLLARYGLVAKNNIVVDMLSKNYNADATVPLINKFDTKHPITRNFKGRIFLPLASSVELKKVSEDIKTKLLAFSHSFQGAGRKPT